MPTYAYKVEGCDDLIDVTMTMREKEEREIGGRLVLPDGRTARRWFGAPPAVPCTRWGYWSNGVATYPENSGNLRKQLAAKGVQARVHDDGRVYIESRSQRRAVMKAMGLRDNDAGYSD